ncbi:phosphoribosyltransferase [Variovorax ginsengisoli]|jgi:predicted phosphoribosyltransferase|uniref:Phosphoribosyltransferase n=1 Tax=Variovorax ginsengisoli TaxID=363844 RepID=A0ABT8RWJ4_9BURK|nr:phosphoribosyltransferase [Variovorax ginsengisoli]MDN8611828.1 phosphoribosyltransferase [Variovorax ginsengisoli]MDO1530998.1 phosphoribosyltransferase [Variovorax ginsengisoli]
MEFKDRRDAGRALAKALEAWRGRPGVLVLALPRGGVPVAWEVARALGAPLDVLVVRKLGFPGQEEYAMGAIASGGVRVMGEADAGWPVSARELEAVVAREQAELVRREQRYRGGRPPLDLAGRVLILVDDGLATGATMSAAVQAARAGYPKQVIVAVPVASTEAVQSLSALADEVVCLFTPEHFRAVGLWYQDFTQTSDEEVDRLLA